MLESVFGAGNARRSPGHCEPSRLPGLYPSLPPGLPRRATCPCFSQGVVLVTRARLLRLPGRCARVSFASDLGCPGTASPAACPTGWRPTCPPDQASVFQGTFLPIRPPRWRRAASAFAARLIGVGCTYTRSLPSRCSSAWSRSRLPTRIRSSSAGWSVRLRCRSCGSSSSPRSSGGCLGSSPARSSAGARGLDATTEAPLLRDLAAWTDQQPPQHVRHEPYDDEDEEYLYWSQAHSLIMHRPELSRKPLVGEKGAPRVIV